MGSPRPASDARAPGFSAPAASRWPGLPGPSAGGPPTSWPPLLSSRHHVRTRAGSARIVPLWFSCSPKRTHLPGLQARNRIHGSWFTGGPNQSIEVGQFRVSNSDTGIVISNISAEPTPEAGPITLHFHGENAPDDMTTPAVRAGKEFRRLASLIAPNFDGSVTAICNFYPARGSV